MVAIDDAGHEHPAVTETTIGDGTTTIGQFLSELPKASIKQWEFQTRPFDQWIEIRHVALHPGEKTQVDVYKRQLILALLPCLSAEELLSRSDL